ALALAVEPAGSQTMTRPPHFSHQPLLSRKAQADVIWTGLLMAVSAIVPGYVYWSLALPQWQTVLFTTVVLSQMANAFAVQTERDSIFRRGRKQNPALWAASFATVVLQLMSVYTPIGMSVFKTSPLHG